MIIFFVINNRSFEIDLFTLFICVSLQSYAFAHLIFCVNANAS